MLGAAEQAALPSGVIYTDAAADAEASQVEPMDTVEMDRGTWMTMPFGWKISQVKAEQPTGWPWSSARFWEGWPDVPVSMDDSFA